MNPTGGLQLRFTHSSRHQIPPSLAFPTPSTVRKTSIRGGVFSDQLPVGTCLLLQMTLLPEDNDLILLL